MSNKILHIHVWIEYNKRFILCTTRCLSYVIYLYKNTIILRIEILIGVAIPEGSIFLEEKNDVLGSQTSLQLP